MPNPSHLRTRLDVELLENRQVMSTLSGLSHPLAKAIVDVANDEPVHNAHGLVRALQKTGVLDATERLDKEQAAELVESLANHVLDALPAPTKNLIETLPAKQATAVVTDLLRSTESVVNNEVREIINLPAILTEILDDVVDSAPRLPNVPDVRLPDGTPGLNPSEKAKLAITNALADLSFFRRRTEFAPAIDSISLEGSRDIDAGRLAHSPTDQAKDADPGQNVSTPKADEFDAMLAKRRHSDSVYATLIFGAIGKGAENEMDLSGMALTPGLADGPVDTAAVDGALARFFAQLDTFGRDLIGTLSEPATMLWIIGLGAGMVSMELARRRVTHRKTPRKSVVTGWAPGLPLPGMN